MRIRKIIAVSFLFVLLLIPDVYAEYPTSTPQTMEPINFNLIEGIKDTLLSIAESTSTERTGGVNESMASGSSASGSVTTVTWTGLGADNKASTGNNWSGNVTPQSGEGVVFDSTSSKDCSWDMLMTLASFSVSTGFTGKITLETNLTVSDDFIWTGMGEDNLASNPANWSKNAVQEDGFKVVFNGRSSKDCDWDISVSPSWLIMETAYAGAVTLNTSLSLSENLNISGGTLNLTGHALTVNGYLLIAQGATLNADTSTITVRGDWLNAGIFNYGQSTVILSGTGQMIYGDTVFYNLEKIAACPGDTLSFEAGSLQTILGRLTLKGTEGCLLALKSTQDGQQWYIDPRGTRNISYASIKDMNNTNFVDIVTIQSNDAGGNSPSVKFGGSQCVCFDEKLILAQNFCGKGDYYE